MWKEMIKVSVLHLQHLPLAQSWNTRDIAMSVCEIRKCHDLLLQAPWPSAWLAERKGTQRGSI
jgi:hypothetical protein